MHATPVLTSFAASFVASLALVPAAPAQTVFGAWTWQVSSDDGQTWRSGVVDALPGQSLRVRALVGWDIVEGGPYAFAGSQFDIAIAGPPANADVALLSTDPGQGRVSQGVNWSQTLLVSRFGDTIKIDDSRDTGAPGAGTRGVFAGQLIEIYAGTNFTPANPVSVFEFTLVLDDTPGTRRLLDYFVAPAGGCVDRSMRLYITADGTQQLPLWNGCGRRQILATTLELYVRCPADFNADRQIDFFDYLDFIAALAAEDARADFNEDGVVDFLDYLDFIAAFDAGCS